MIDTISMSVVCLKLLAIFCLYWTALTDAETSGVVWKDPGEDITIQCRGPQNQEYLSLRMRLNEESEVLHAAKNSPKLTIASEFTGRLQSEGTFPNINILLKDLRHNDTGLYICVYKAYNATNFKIKITEGKGSVLLVVAGEKHAAADVHGRLECGPSQQDLVLVSVVISAAVLLVIIMIFLIWIIRKNKTQHTTVKPRRVATNDVYEDMRATIRR